MSAAVRRLPGVARSACALLALSAANPGCADVVDPGAYGPDDSLSVDDAGLGVASVGAVSPAQGGPANSGSHPPVSASSDAGVGADASSPARGAGPCDLTGRWLVVQRTLTDALGAKEAVHEWYYYELVQSGSQVTVTKGLVCGGNVRGVSAASGNVDYPKVWPAMMAKISSTGRKGVSAPTTGGCQVSFEKIYEVSGATEGYYSDPGRTLPSASEQASGSTPGWEDWDQDGQPGYTMNVTGLATGQLYMANRDSFALSGTVAASATSFDLAVDFDVTQDALGINGPPILSSNASAVKDSDPSQHFATFVRLTDTQATGSDSSVCAAIRSLAPTLAPRASN